MAHQMTENDNAVYHKNPAWHGLGTVVEEAPTCMEAIKLAEMEWTIEQEPALVQMNGGEYMTIPGKKVNLRSDLSGQDAIMGVVSEKYSPFQNKDLALFGEALNETGTVKVESCGSLYGGKKVYMLLKGEEFDVKNGDSVYPYLLLSNGHDGSTAFQVIPTTIRVVCANTLNMVVSNAKNGVTPAAIRIKHTLNLENYLEEARIALLEYSSVLEETKEVMHSMAQSEINQQRMKEFFFKCYEKDFGAIPNEEKNKSQARKIAKAQKAFNCFDKRFEEESHMAGNTVWNAFNAYSGMIQHDLHTIGLGHKPSAERKTELNLTGLNQERTLRAMKSAFTMVG